MENYSNTAKVFKAFCDENRLLIIEKLRQQEMCACDLLEKLPIGQSTLSHHMKILIDSGVVSSRKGGKWTYYSLSEVGSRNALELLEIITKRDENYVIDCNCS